MRLDEAGVGELALERLAQRVRALVQRLADDLDRASIAPETQNWWTIACETMFGEMYVWWRS